MTRASTLPTNPIDRQFTSSFVIAGFAASALAACSLTPSQRDRNSCSDHSASGGQLIAACSAVLQQSNLSKANQSVAYYNRGIGYGLNGQTDAAISDYTQAIAIRPDYADAYNNRGAALIRKREWDAAIPDLTEAITLDPNSPNAYYNRGLAYEAKGIDAQAIADYRAELKLDPDLQKAKDRLARLGSAP